MPQGNNDTPYFDGNGPYPGRYRGEGNGQWASGSSFDEDEIDLRRLLSLLWRNKFLIIGVTLLFTIAAGVVAWNMMPIYKSSGTMLIKSQKGSTPLSGGEGGISQIVSSSFGIGMGSTVKNELQILKSRSLANDVANRLLKDPIMNNGRMYPVLWRSFPKDSILTSRDTVARRINNKLKFSRVDREADIVKISYKSPVPQAAANVVDKAMKAYQELSTRQSRRMARSALDFLRKERKRIRRQLHQATEKLRKFRNKAGLVKVEEQAKKLIKTISELESKKQEVRGKLVAVTSGIEKYKEQLNQIEPGIAKHYADAIAPRMSRYQYQLAELETKKMLMLQRNPSLRDSSQTEPALRRLNDKIAMIKDRINKQAEKLIQKNNQYLGFLGSPTGNLTDNITKLHRKLIDLKVKRSKYRAQMKVLNKRLDQQRTFFEKLPDNMIKLARLKRDVKINEKLYMTVSNQFAEMKLWKQTQFGKGQPIDYGYIPEQPVEPQKMLYLVVGFLLGGILSVGYVFTREAFNTSIDGAEKLEERTYPVLAVIPNIDPLIDRKYEGQDTVEVRGSGISTRLVTVLDNISPEAEAFRRLINNVLYADPDRDYQTLMVTSSSKGEGKTTVAGNMAVALAEAGKKVALVDVDFRRPYVHRFFGKPQSPGLIEIIFNEAESDEAIQPTVVDNVDIVASGRRPPNPAAVTQSDRLQETIESLKERYDHILLDTAPYGIITDAAPVVRLSDGVLIVTRFGMTHEAELDRTIESLERIEAPIVGTILSAFEYKKSSDYYYSGSYYRYAYRDYYRYHERD